jgi:putative transposase
VAILTDEHGLPVQRACRIARFSRTAYYRAQTLAASPEAADAATVDAPIIDALGTVVEKHGRWGFWKCYERLRALGHAWNHKRVHRVYRALGLNQKRRTKKRVPPRDAVPLDAPARLNETWALDFMGDSLYSGRAFRLLNVLDEGNREVLAIEVDVSLPSARVVEVLDQLVALHGIPRQVRCDNGPEFLAEVFGAWCAHHGIRRAFIQPGKPNQNAYIERFNRSFRHEVLDAYLFTSLEDVRRISTEWRESYNTERAHESLGHVPPLTFLPRPTLVPVSRLQLSA